MDYIEKQPEKKTEENLISLLSKKPIFDPETIIIFDICSFIKTESDAIRSLQNEGSTSIDMAGSKEKTMMKNTTMKMSVNPLESMDKFLQRLEKSLHPCIDFLASGNKAKAGFENRLHVIACLHVMFLKTIKGIGNNSKTSARCSLRFK